jgi:ubiquinone/menaquinone biosynthesis C-methylase UbiE
MDCDFTHTPDRIIDFLKFGAENDVVVGSRYLRKGSLKTWNLLRKALTRVGHLLTTHLLGMPYDATGAFRLYRLDRIPAGEFSLIQSKSYSFFFESLYVLWQNGARIHEVPIDLPARTYGSSKMAWKDALRSTMLLVYLYLKKRIDPRELLYVEPFLDSGSVNPTEAQIEWDSYWQQQKSAGILVYDIIAAFYRKVLIKPILNRFTKRHFPAGSRVLHAGCGGGQVDTDLAKRVRISALDISTQALSMYKKCQPNVERLIHGTVFGIDARDCSYDGIYNLGVMEHFTVPEINQILAEFNRVLKSGGKIILFWPPAFGFTVRVLAAVHWCLRKAGRAHIKLHPDEITHVTSRRQVRAFLEQNGFSLVDFYFGFQDFFTQAVVVGQKGTINSAKSHSREMAVTSVPLGFGHGHEAKL